MLLREEVCLTSWYLSARNGSAAKPLISRQRISPGPARAQSRRLPQHTIASLPDRLYQLIRGATWTAARSTARSTLRIVHACLRAAVLQPKSSWSGPSGGRYS